MGSEGQISIVDRSLNERTGMHSKGTSCVSLATLHKQSSLQHLYENEKPLLTPQERSDSLELLGCSSWDNIEPDPDKNGEEYVRKRLKQLFLKKTNEIKN